MDWRWAEERSDKKEDENQHYAEVFVPVDKTLRISMLGLGNFRGVARRNLSFVARHEYTTNKTSALMANLRGPVDEHLPDE